MKATNFLRAGLAVALGALVGVVAVAKEPKDPDKSTKQRESLYKGAGTPTYAVLNINNLTTWHRYDGHSNHTPKGADGVHYPRGTGNAIYQDCIVWGGKVFTNASYTGGAINGQQVRVGGGTYGIGTRAGRVTGRGAAAVAEAPANADVRIFRLRRDYFTMTTEELRRDAASVNEIAEAEVTQTQIDNVKAQYALDWTEWPIAKGAPFIDRNGNGVYDPPPAFNLDPGVGAVFTVDSLITQGRDEPGVAGGDPNSPADQVIWTVFNDLNVTDARNFVGSLPIGVEVQKTIWGYKRADALGNLYFARYKMINVGGVDTSNTAGDQLGSFWVDSMYVCQWSDPDLGSFSDDLLGCDTTLSVGFVYNANAVDDTYRRYNLPPPSAGYDFLAGPLVPAPGDSAVFDLKRRYGVRNLGMSSFAYFSAGSPYSDPPGGASNYDNGTGRWWKMLRGFAPTGSINTGDSPYNFPTGGSASKFPLSGDPSKPASVSNWIDGQGQNWSFPPGDRRLLVTTGPFRLAPGDTQEVYVGVVVGLGSDRLSSVSVMKFNDRFVQNTFTALFQVPRAPTAPDVKFAELDGEIVLEWGSNHQRVTDTETRVNNPGAFAFEGYNVYQLPSRGSRLAEGRRIITYDKPTDPTVVFDEQFDQASGSILSLPVQFGSNSGIKRSYRVTRDWVRDIEKLYNGQEYYFVVTAYAVATTPGFLPKVLESEPVVLTVRPKLPFGREYANKTGDLLTVTHPQGISGGIITATVVNPAATTGQRYRVSFDSTGAYLGRALTWSIRNTGTNTVVWGPDSNQTNDEQYPIVEGGVHVSVKGPLAGIKRLDVFDGAPASEWGWDWPTGSRFMTWANADGFAFEGFRGAWGWESPVHFFNGRDNRIPPASLKAVRLVFSYTATNQPGSFNTAADDTASYAYRYLRAATLAPQQPSFAVWITNPAGGYRIQDYRISAPLSAYNIDVNPPQRLAVAYMENNQPNGLVDGFYWPAFFNAVPGGTNTAGNGPREWLWIFDSPYTGSTQNAAWTDILNQDAIPVMYWGTWNRRNDNPWPAGNTFVINPGRINTPNDVFEYTTPAPTSGASQEKLSAEKVGVYPNPYYAYNPAETNRFARFVTFNNLPPVAKIRIFNLAGQLVRTIDKNDGTQFARWDLTNHSFFPVASGMYIAHVELKMPTDGSTITKVLKFAVIQEQEILDAY